MTISPRRSTTLARPFLALLAFTTLFTLPATVSATLLSTLLAPGASLDVGTLQFGGFSYLNTGDMPGAGDVNVVPSGGCQIVLSHVIASANSSRQEYSS